jgi:hypothetical protein
VTRGHVPAAHCAPKGAVLLAYVRAAADFLTIEATLAEAAGAVAFCSSLRWLRRIFANVFLRSVLKLAV